jgi:tetratricopeptide (TPR) repeat protein
MNPELLDTFGILLATDKSSLRWDYLRHYEPLFAPLRDAPINLLELGVGGGNSLMMWERFFSQATIIGIDIAESARRAAGGRRVVDIGSQTDTAFLDALCDRYPPTIIVDDGSHQAPHIMASFRHLFPKLPPGGWYAIEDLSITGSMHDVPLTPHDFFAQTALALMHRRPGTHPDPGLLAQIDRVQFAPGLVFVQKKHLPERQAWLPHAADLARRTTNPNNYHWLAEVLMDECGDLAGAEVAARRAAELHPAAAVYHLGLTRVLERKGDLAAAIAAARDATTAEPNNFQCHLRLGELLARSGAMAAAADSLQRAVEVAPEHLRRHADDERIRILAEPSATP